MFSGMSVRPWTCFHIDELRSGDRDLDIAKLSREKDIGAALDANLINLKSLILECVPKAASEVATAPMRVQKRIDILLDALVVGKCNVYGNISKIFCQIIQDLSLIHI